MRVKGVINFVIFKSFLSSISISNLSFSPFSFAIHFLNKKKTPILCKNNRIEDDDDEYIRQRKRERKSTMRMSYMMAG